MHYKKKKAKQEQFCYLGKEKHHTHIIIKIQGTKGKFFLIEKQIK